jgi:hypothetical protein
MRVICDEHDVEMVRIFDMCWYECPIGECQVRVSDETISRLGNAEEVRVT